MALLDISFSDLFIGSDLASSSYKATPDSRILSPLPANETTEFNALRASLLDRWQGNPNDFRLEWGTTPQPVLLRVKPIRTAYITPLFVCRRSAPRPGSMLDLGFPPEIVKRLLERPFKTGVVLFIGQMASGKSTAASAFILDYTRLHGGICLTVESPIEMDLEGPYGDGYVYQHEVKSEDEMARELRGMLRSSANMLFPSEAKYDETVREINGLATTGHRVVTTFHGSDIPSGLARWSRQSGGQNDALADGLAAVFHLTLNHYDNQAAQQPARGNLPGHFAPPPRLLQVSPLLVLPENQTVIRSNIRSGAFQQLNSEIERQKNMFLTGGLP